MYIVQRLHEQTNDVYLRFNSFEIEPVLSSLRHFVLFQKKDKKVQMNSRI